MGKNKNKCKEDGLGPSSRLEEDPILAMALTRTEKDPHSGQTRATSPISVKHLEIDGRSIAVMVDDGADVDKEVNIEASENLSAELEQISEGESPERHFEDVSQTLGDRQNAQLKSGNDLGQSSAVKRDGTEGKGNQVAMKKSFASLFAKNRLPSTGSKQEFINPDVGTIQLEKEDFTLSECPWERCLVGYFGGRFPGKNALNQIVASWNVHPSIQFHGSGWIIFQFNSLDDQAKVLENGPYMIYGSPLLLKQMDKYFSFGKEAISTFPVWVQLRNVPLTMWNSMIFSKIYSRLGRPIHMDKLTTQKERVTFARCLVEVDMAKELIHSVTLRMPEGGEHEQWIYYENLPKYCPHCRVAGHTKENCKNKTGSSNKATGKNSATIEKVGPQQTLIQQEWVIK